ncbi:hypothetical protein ACOJR9_11900 [Alteromonas sp. A081]|uniref:hypothetical protein n=1 Tax=Alteromonas sp. A081 TaxID=3410269 RepID=UPI003B985AD7
MEIRKLLIIFLLSFLSVNRAIAGSYADMLEAYIPENSENCQSSEFPPGSGNFQPDYQTNGVCFPMTSFVRGDFLEYHMYAVVELTNPDYLEEYAAHRKASKIRSKEASSKKNFEAYIVHVDSFEKNTLRFTDGTYGTVPFHINVHYYQLAILFRDRNEWFVCAGGNVHRYNLIFNSDLFRSSPPEKSAEELRDNSLC